MLAYALLSTDPVKVGFIDKPVPKPQAGQALVRISAAALNRRDYWISVGKYPGLRDGVTLGSDGCGVVEEVGEGVAPIWVNKRVVINPNISWGQNPYAQAASYHIMGMPTDGSFAPYVVVDADRLTRAPQFLTDEEAAAVPLAGLTAFRAVFTRGEVQAGHKVLITGIGGGVAQFAMQFALAAGAEVYVTSRNANKIDQAKMLGASEGFDYSQPDWVKQALLATGGIDLIVDSVGGSLTNQYINLCKTGGNIVFYGATLGPAEKLDLAKIFWKQINLKGSTMGNDSEFVQMLDFVTRHQIRPLIHAVDHYSTLSSMVAEMGEGGHFGKLVVTMG